MRVDPTTPGFQATNAPQPRAGIRASAQPARPPDPDPDVRLDVAIAPAHVLERVHEAAARAAELARHNRELHFEKDPGSARVIVQVRDLDGHLIRTIPPSRALELLSPEARR